MPDILEELDSDDFVLVERGHVGSGETGHASVDVVAARARSFGPFTDGDGNVYSIEFDSDSQQLAVQCVTPDDVFSRFLVTPGQLDVVCSDLAGNVTVISSTGGQIALQCEPAEGDSHSVQVNNNGFVIDGIGIDPTAPWPGG